MPRRRRRRRTRTGRSTRQYKQSHRYPPLPAHYHTRVGGICRWCGKPITDEQGNPLSRRLWHKECLHYYFIVTKPSYAKRQVKKRDKCICLDCGKFCKYRNEWQLDHNKPLIEAKGDIWFWTLENLVTRCVACHCAKTVKENNERRKLKCKKKN